ncbi:carbohydrate sulfotransferase 1-like [Ylistrum balloti]|uniref:carbohydrate sulfotransferase 1-like n=1 Tax=Ylistrum balloti TaxID=509963 RepID=UPI002905C1BE|nr:carbohydrate sulfotransferase 1-like [Ylistrum balloti]
MTWNDCLEKYLHQCSNRVSKVSKIPRLSISLASKLLDELPNLKIIHLIRDPRAIMNSRDKFSWTPVPGGAVSLCKKIMADYLSSVEVKRAHPGRLYTVFYEEIAGNPIETFRGIYDFLGYQFSKNDQIRLTARTASSKQGNAGSTYRFNSAKTASTWKKQINSTVLKETNKACFSVYQLLGYPEFKGS